MKTSIAGKHDHYLLPELHISMSDSHVVELNDEQRNLLLRSLKYVRSSVLLATARPTEEIVQKRAQNLEEVEALISHLNDLPKTSAAAV